MRIQRAALSLGVILALAGCGGEDHVNHRGTVSTNPANGSGDGTGGSPVELALAQAPSNVSAGDPRLANTVWGLASGTEGAGVAFAADARYAALVLRVTSGATVEAMATVGTYAVSDETFAVHRTRTTCPDLPGRSTAPAQYKLVDDQTLWLSSGAATAVLKRVTPASTPALVISWGCFDSAGSFTPHAWTNL